jgi:type III secretion protein Q
MLDAAAAKDDAAHLNAFEGEADWQPVRLAEVPAQYLRALSAFYRRRRLPKVQMVGRVVSFAPIWRRDRPEIADPWTLALRIDDQPTELIVPEVFLDLLLDEVEGLVSFDALWPEQRALILEYALSEAFEALETALGCPVSLSAVREGAEERTIQSVPPLLLTVETQGMEQSWCVLLTSEAHTLLLARGLDRIAGASAPGSLVDLPVPIRIRWAAVDLALAELKSLRPGDIVLVDAYCMEPETALAVMGDALVAPVKMLPKGYQLLDSPKPVAGSGFEWGANRPPAATGFMRDSTAKDLPVRLFLEMNGFELSWTGLHDLKRGAQIGTDVPRKSRIELVIEGTTIGWGELTVLGIGLGVRVTRI